MILQRLTAVTPGLEVLFGGYLKFYGVEKDGGEIRSFLSHNVSSTGVVVCAVLDGGVEVGFCQSYIIPNSLSLKKMAIFNDLYIMESHRGQGLAKQLMDFNERILQSLGVDRCELSTATNNKIAQDLYRRESWKLESEFYYFYKFIAQ